MKVVGRSAGGGRATVDPRRAQICELAVLIVMDMLASSELPSR